MVRNVAFIVTLGVAVTACAGGDGASTPTTSSVLSTTTPSPADDPRAEEQAVIDAYLGAIDAFYAAANPPDPDHPALDKTYGNPLLENVQRFLADLAARGIAVERGGATENHPQVRRILGDRAELTDCLNDSDIQRDVATGEVVDDSVIYSELTAVLEKRDGAWLVVSRSETSERAVPCAE